MRAMMLPSPAIGLGDVDARRLVLVIFDVALGQSPPISAKKKARPPRLIAGWAGRLNSSVLLYVLLHEGMDRRVGNFGVTRGIIEIGDLDVAAGLAVIA